jgi:hypothetical protein
MNPWFSFTSAAVMFNAPSDAGIYVLAIPRGECLLVGEAKNVQRALLELLESDTPWKQLAREIIFSTERIDGSSRALRERELIAEMQPRLSRVDSPA